MMQSHTHNFVPGLEGIIAAETRLSRVNGQIGELIIAGYSLEQLALNATFEEVVYLLWHGQLPTENQLAGWCQRLATLRGIPAATQAILEAAAQQNVGAMDALRMAVGTLDLDHYEGDDEVALALVARAPTIVATYWRMCQQLPVIEPDRGLSHAANYLYMLSGKVPSAARTRALDTYLCTVSDHGFNASTFTARVIVSTQSDMVSAITGAIGALKGPLHGGAPGPALDMVFAIGSAGNAEPYIREKLERGERLMGFGHRVYKVRDPRAEVLSQAAAALFINDGDMALYELVKAVEQTAVALLAEYKPERNLQTNVEFYTALLLHGLDLETDLFSPTFAIGRLSGWIAHCREQLENNRIFRPKAAFTGATDLVWTPLPMRSS